MKLGWVVMISAATATAAPAAKRCVPSDASQMTIVGVAGKAIVCWRASGDCMALEDGTTAPRPTPVAPAATVRDDSGKLSACNGKTCKPLGTQLAAAVAKARGRADAVTADGSTSAADISVTSDLAMAAIGAPALKDEPAIVEMWNVATDKKLALKPPAVYGKSTKVKLVRVQTAGNLALASWGECDSPCALKEIAVEPSGGNRSKAFEGGDTFALENGFAIVSGQTSKVTTLDRTGRHSGELSAGFSMGTDGSSPELAVIGADEAVMISAYNPNGGRSFVHIKVAKSGKPTITSRADIADCAAP